MKAYDVMMYTLIFNLMVFTLISLGVFAGVEYFSSLTFSNAIVTAAGAGVTVIAGLFSGAAIVGFFTKSTRPSTLSYAYILFSGVFWLSYYASLTVFNSMIVRASGYGIEVLWLYLFFTILMVYVFIAGMIQMTTGGWKSYK